MKHFLFGILLRVSVLVLLPILVILALLRAVLRGFAGADQVPAPPSSCVLQLVVMPVYAPIAMSYLAVCRLFNAIMVRDAESGFGGPGLFYAAVIKLAGDRNMRMLYQITFAGRERQ